MPYYNYIYIYIYIYIYNTEKHKIIAMIFESGTPGNNRDSVMGLTVGNQCANNLFVNHAVYPIIIHSPF